LLEIKPDCRHYRGDRPCIHNRLCEGCRHYDPWKEKILIIKTAAMGDVLRTTTILPALRAKYPGSKVTWLTDPASAPLLYGNSLIDEIVLMDASTVPALLPRKFDIVLSLDKEKACSGLAMILNAGTKLGMGLSEHGTAYPLNAEAEYAFSLGLSDDLKFRKNQKTYVSLLMDICGLEGEPASPRIELSAAEMEESARLLGTVVDSGKKRIGVVVGAGSVFANKTPSPEKWREIITAVEAEPGAGYEIILLGGPGEKEKIEAVKSTGGRLLSVEPVENVRLFAGVISQMDGLICGDTLAMHIACAVNVPALVLFGPTCPNEIDLFSNGVKLVSPIDCAPCYLRVCDKKPNCMDVISAEEAGMKATELFNRGWPYIK